MAPDTENFQVRDVVVGPITIDVVDIQHPRIMIVLTGHANGTVVPKGPVPVSAALTLPVVVWLDDLDAAYALCHLFAEAIAEHEARPASFEF